MAQVIVLSWNCISFLALHRSPDFDSGHLWQHFFTRTSENAVLCFDLKRQFSEMHIALLFLLPGVFSPEPWRRNVFNALRLLHFVDLGGILGPNCSDRRVCCRQHSSWERLLHHDSLHVLLQTIFIVPQRLCYIEFLTCWTIEHLACIHVLHVAF